MTQELGQAGAHVGVHLGQQDLAVEDRRVQLRVAVAPKGHVAGEVAFPECI